MTGTRDGDRVDVVTSEATGPAPAWRTTGPISVLIIPVYWSVPPDDVTPSQAVSQIGTTDNAWFQEVSYGQTSLTATSTPWLQIAPPVECSFHLARAAESAAVSAGYDPSAFDRRLFYFPAASCPDDHYAGWAELTGSWVWIQGAMDSATTIHEEGHNYGLGHANSLTCTDPAGDLVPLSTTCAATEYGDRFDVMGGYGWRGLGHFNASMLDYLGWMGEREKTVTGPASMTLRPIESSQAALQGVKVIDGAQTFWIEYRQPVGVDSWLSSYPWATDGVLVHTREPYIATSYLLDMRANDDWWDAALPTGATWTDPLGDVTISVGRVSPSGARVNVSYAGTVINGFTPTEGPAGTAVEILGSGFADATEVSFDGAHAAFTVRSDTTITASVPEAAITGPITVTTPVGTATSASDFAVTPKLKITRVTPNPFDPNQGQSTTITWTQDRPAYVELRATDEAGSEVWYYDYYDEDLSAGRHAFVWDGRSEEGAVLPPGVYTVQVLGWDSTGCCSAWAGATVTVSRAAPTVNLPVPSFVWNQQLSLGPPVTVRSKVTWSSVAGSTACSYRAQMKVNGGSYADLGLASPTATKATTALAVGDTYRFRVRAIGCEGAMGPWATGAAFTVRGSQQGAATYGTGWSSGALSGSWGGTVRYTTTVAGSTTFTFTGQAIAWIGTKGPGYGSADVYIDGVPYQTVGDDGPNIKTSYVVVADNWTGTSGTHTITIVNTGTSGHPRNDVDGFIVFS